MLQQAQIREAGRVGFAAAAGFSDLRLLEHVEIKGATTIAMIQRACHAILTAEAATILPPQR
ncbi:hypothetical protein MAHJHV50_50800 [Mycobacterium avium subsp. hominissuis]